MKKYVLPLAILLASASVYAEQCPPVSALMHTKWGDHWVLRDIYTSNGWYVAHYPHGELSHQNIPGSNHVIANLVSNEDAKKAQWFVTCEYDASDKGEAFLRKVVIAKNEIFTINWKLNPIPNFEADPLYPKRPRFYYCATNEGSAKKCEW